MVGKRVGTKAERAQVQASKADMLQLFAGKSGAASTSASSASSPSPSLAPPVPESWSLASAEQQDAEEIPSAQASPPSPVVKDVVITDSEDAEPVGSIGDVSKGLVGTSWTRELFDALAIAELNPAQFGENVEELIGKAINSFATKKPKNSGELNDETVPSELEKLLQSAATEGKFDMRQRIGQLWARELKSDPELKKKYQEAGKNYEAQRSFRTAWSAKKYVTVKEDRMKTVRQRASDDTWGSYEPTAIVHEREGKDKAGAKATLNYVRKCLQLHEKGYNYRNRAFVMWNSFTERYDFLYIKRGFRDSLEEIWSMSIVDAIAGEPAPASSTTGVSEATPEKEGKNRKSNGGMPEPTSGSKRKTKEAEGEAVLDPDADKKKRAKKELDTCVSKAKMAKTKMLAAQAGYTDLMKAIDGAPEWAWAASDALKNPATEARTALEAFKNSGKFWQDFVLQPDWVVHCKKNYNAENVLCELHKIPKLEMVITKLDAEVRRLTSMHNAGKQL